MSNQFLAENAYLLGKSKFELWRRNFELHWVGRDIEASMNIAAKGLYNLPDDIKNQIKAMDPSAWGSVERLVSKQRKRG